MPRSRIRRLAAVLGRSVLYATALVLVLIGLALAAVETGWGKNQLRGLIVRQANLYLTATLDIDRLSGSLLRGIDLTGIRVSRDGRTLISIDRVSLSYSLRELYDQGTAIRAIRLERPHVVAGRQPDGRWDLAALVKREVRQEERIGPRRPLHLNSIEVVDGTIELRDPVSFGAAHLPTRFDALNTSLAFDYEPVAWRLDFEHLSWRGSAPDLTLNRLNGGVSSGNDGLAFKDLSVETPRSAFVLNGRVVRSQTPTVLDLQVKAARFVFQEWAGILTGLKNLAVDAAFDVRLTGPLARLQTDLNLRSNGGNVRGPLVLDTTVPGWHGAGTVDLERLDLARWFNRADRPSNISGRVVFDFALNLGHPPTGSYTFTGTHAGYMGYEADGVRLTGTIVSSEARIAKGTALAYGATVELSQGTIAFNSPYAFRFRGSVDQIDLRRLPAPVPIPHVESLLSFVYDVNGQFVSSFIKGVATFAPSEFLGASIDGGATGAIDTSPPEIRYSGEGDLEGVDLHRFGRGLGVEWMQQPRYAGALSGHFRVDGRRSSSSPMTLDGGGRLNRAAFFGGLLTDADVSVHIEGGTLEATYDGRLDRVNPALALNDPRFTASLSGSGRAAFRVRDLLVRAPALEDYAIDAAFAVEHSTVRGVQVDGGRFVGRLLGGSLAVDALEVAGPALTAGGAGTVALDGTTSSQFDYHVARADLGANGVLGTLVGRDVRGELVTSGRLTGPMNALRFVGEGTIERLDASGVRSETTTASYDVTLPPDAPMRATARLEGRASTVAIFDQPLQEVSGTVTYDDRRLDLDLAVTRNEQLSGRIAGAMLLNQDGRSLEVSRLALAIKDSAWRLTETPLPSSVAWNEGGLSLGLMTFEEANHADQRVAVSGTWRTDGTGALRATATRVFLDTLTSQQPARYGGVVDADAVLSGTWDRPSVSATLAITEGRVRQLSYQKLAGRMNYSGEALSVDLRLDQAPGVWLTAAGTVPLSLFDTRLPEQPMDVAIASSTVALGLIEGVTTVVRDVTGTMRLDVNVIGTSRDPHFAGTVVVDDAAFIVASSGSRYKNGRAALQLGSDRVVVETFHLEDNRGRSLELSGSLGTHELRVGDLEIDATAKGFEVLRNEFGTIEIDAQLRLRGVAESPRIEGRLTIASGELKVDQILDRTLFRPYATEAALPLEIDAVAALNPWERLGLDIELHVPGTLRMTGDELQVTSGTPLGLGSINLRAVGDLYLYKDPGDVMYVTGSLDSITGTYAFQGRRFDINPVSSINFQGDLNPELFVTVDRLISGVATQVTIVGPLRTPELQLTSTPLLEPSDILSLIVFGTSTNQLSGSQQQQLAIRAGTIAAGFLATPLLGALERSLGLDILEIEAPSDSRSGPRVTIGDELAPGLVARFSRQFGPEEYDEATLEYYLSRILRIRATFSDAATLNARSPFRRTERAGIDLILFFSF